MRRLISRITQWYERTVARARARWPVVDHAWRTKERYGEVFGGRLAAAIAYFGFFAVFALGVVGYAVLGYLVEFHVDIGATVDEFLQENMPVLDASQVSDARGAAGIIGLAGLVLTGVAWVEALRSSQRLIWGLEQAPGNIWLRRLVDVGVLAALAVLLGVSFALASGVERLLQWLPETAQTVLAWVLAAAVNLVLAVALLAALPRLRLSPRRLLPPAVVVAIGLVVLNTLGTAYIGRTQENPAYAVVAAAAGVLVYLYLFNQLLLWSATWAATSERGRMIDLAPAAEPAPEADS